MRTARPRPGASCRTSATNSAARRASRCTAALLGFAVLAGCTGTSPPGGDGRPPSPEETTGGTAGEDATPVTVAVDGDDLVLELAGDAQVVATVEDAELLHAAVRPGYDRPVTVLALTRDDDGFALRYLDVVDGEPSELYRFPFRLQVDPEAARVADVPPVPVWSPDGDRVAWLEWTVRGTRLRTLGWLTYEARSNPSEERGDWELGDVPVGTQLGGWERETDGTPVLVSRPFDGEQWRIRLEDDGPIAATAASAVVRHRT